MELTTAFSLLAALCAVFFLTPRGDRLLGGAMEWFLRSIDRIRDWWTWRQIRKSMERLTVSAEKMRRLIEKGRSDAGQ